LVAGEDKEVTMNSKKVEVEVCVTRGGHGWSGNLILSSSRNVDEEKLALIREIWLTLDTDRNGEKILITDADNCIKIHGHITFKNKKDAIIMASRLGTGYFYHEGSYWVEADPRTILKV